MLPFVNCDSHLCLWIYTSNTKKKGKNEKNPAVPRESWLVETIRCKFRYCEYILFNFRINGDHYTLSAALKLGGIASSTRALGILHTSIFPDRQWPQRWLVISSRAIYNCWYNSFYMWQDTIYMNLKTEAGAQIGNGDGKSHRRLQSCVLVQFFGVGWNDGLTRTHAHQNTNNFRTEWMTNVVYLVVLSRTQSHWRFRCSRWIFSLLETFEEEFQWLPSTQL